RKKIFKIFSISFGVLFTVFLLISPKILSSNIDEIKSNETYHKINEISTDRINIWIKTLNLSKDDTLIGSGADTFPFNITLKDEDKGMSTYNEFIDKPHNWYLSIFYSFGILGFILFMIIVIDFIYSLFNNIDDKNGFKYGYIFGIGTITYLVQALSNDSFTGTAIIFWIMMSIIFNNIKQKNAN
ncbi:MAG: O-antigen ligase family protein, partial [Peptostreptococcaceae bacterium]